MLVFQAFSLGFWNGTDFLPWCPLRVIDPEMSLIKIKKNTKSVESNLLSFHVTFLWYLVLCIFKAFFVEQNFAQYWQEYPEVWTWDASICSHSLALFFVCQLQERHCQPSPVLSMCCSISLSRYSAGKTHLRQISQHVKLSLCCLWALWLCLMWALRVAQSLLQ